MDNPDQVYLGTGWAFPPCFSRSACSAVMVSAEQDIRESLWILLSTMLGERVLLPTYGCGIWQAVFRSMTTTLATEIADYVRQAVLYWEARIDVDRVDVRPDADRDGVLLIEIDYSIRHTNARNNLVYPFYLKEGTIALPPP